MKGDVWLLNWHLILASLGMIFSKKTNGKPIYGNLGIEKFTGKTTEKQIRFVKYNSKFTSNIINNYNTESDTTRNKQDYAVRQTRMMGIVELSNMNIDLNKFKPELTGHRTSNLQTRNFIRLKKSINTVEDKFTTKGRVISSELKVTNSITASHFSNLSKYADVIAFKEQFYKLSRRKQMDLDAQRAYFCVVFIIITLMFVVWYAGLCKIRKHSIFDVVDFERSQPLTNVQDVMMRKSKFLPMFDRFYYGRNTLDRATDP